MTIKARFFRDFIEAGFPLKDLDFTSVALLAKTDYTLVASFGLSYPTMTLAQSTLVPASAFSNG